VISVKLRKGDPVRVITGKDKGKEGVVERVLPRDNKVIVTGVNTAAKHQRARRANEQAGIIDKDMPVDVSNVMYVHKGKTVRLGYKVDAKGAKVRIARPSGEEV
jgi:large subunit ribosomal protein L24